MFVLVGFEILEDGVRIAIVSHGSTAAAVEQKAVNQAIYARLNYFDIRRRQAALYTPWVK